MMKLSLMEGFFRSVDEDWSSPSADLIASRWFPDPDSVKIMRASANFAALVLDDGRHYTMRFNFEELRPMEALQSEIRLLLSLRNFQLPVQKPIKSLDGNYSELVSTDSGRFTAVMFEYIPGEIKSSHRLSDEEFLLWGTALGRLHHTLAENQFTHSIHHPHILEQLKSAQPPSAQGSDEKSALLDWISGLDKNSSNYGLIHYDFELDNLIWDDQGDIHMIDFDDSAFSWYLADLAFAFQDLWDGSADLSDPRFQRFLDGYRRAKSLEQEMLANLDGFVRLDNFLNYHRLLKAVDLEQDSSRPEWTNQLISKLTDRLTTLENRFTGQPVALLSALS